MPRSCKNYYYNLYIYLQIMSDESDASSPPKVKKSPIQTTVVTNDREIELLEENKKLRKKLKQLSAKLDDEL